MKQKNFPWRYHNMCLILFSLPPVLLIVSCSIKEKKGSEFIKPIIALELSPSENNPRNSEGDFINPKDARILFVYSHYTAGFGGDHDPAFLAGRYSEDGGKTWTEEDELILVNEGGMNVMSVSLLRLPNYDIALFYYRKNSTVDCIPFMQTYKDEARPWSEATPCITDKEGCFVLNNERGNTTGRRKTAYGRCLT